MTEIDTGTEQLTCRIEDGVAVLTLNRPEARNALSMEIRHGLMRMIPECAANPDVGVVVLTGAGGAFCAGGDVKGMGDRRAKPPSREQAVREMQERQRAMSGALMAMEKPTIAVLPGAAAGAGLALALACDIRIAAERAFISTGYAKVGLSGDYGIAWLLTRLIGTSRARELMFTAERVDSARCAELGLFNKVVPDAAVMDEALAYARGIAAGPRVALGLIKRNLNHALDADYLSALDHEAELLEEARQTADHKEAVQAFVEKRKPVFGQG
tara:strand:- start:38 stop:850 length:813 start_codon:yes stop_codon:yes gene_type:complete